jgi:alpha-N-arabinofuranosidase
VVFRSRQVDGPYTPWSGNPILTQRDLPNTDPTAVTSTGHADLLIGPDNRWWSVFLGVRPYEGRFSPTGRETFLLPVTWTEDGWPRILEAGKRVPLVGKAPEGAACRPSALKLNGVGEWRDDFTEAKLSPLWIMLRAPSAPWWKIDAAKGQLELTPRGETLSGTGNPSYLARRVQHARFAAATAVEVPADAAASAGLVVFQGERFNYFLGVKKSEEGAVVFVEKAGGGRPEIVASTRIHDANTVALKVDAADAVCRFSFSEGDRGDRWTTLLNKADAKILTTEVAGGFVGATVGVYARLDPSSNQGK